jgi:hypothetical protein
MIADLGITLFAYMFLFGSIWGIGRITLMATEGFDAELGGFFYPFWCGLSCTLFLVQLMHIWFPISGLVSLAILVPGAIVAIVHLQHCGSFPPRLVLVDLTYWILLWLLLVVVIASKAMLTPDNYDSGLYHFNSVRWINEYPLVVGLGNLHGRLAFNQSCFSFVALINPISFNHGHNVGVSFIFIVLLSEFLQKLYVIWRKASQEEKLLWHEISACMFPFLILYYCFSRSLSSPAPDSFVFAMQIIQISYLWEYLERKVDEERNKSGLLTALILLSVCSVTCKLSNAVFTIGILLSILISLGLSSWYRRLAGFRVGLVCFLSLLTIGVWMVRGLMISGVPMYPSTLFQQDFDWSVPSHIIRGESETIVAWARMPGARPSEVLGTLDWIYPWFLKTAQTPDIAYPFFVMVIGSVFLIRGFYFAPKRTIGLVRLLVCYLPFVSGLMFWVLTAPAPRFLGCLFWVVSMTPWVEFFAANQTQIRRIWGFRVYLVLAIFPMTIAFFKERQFSLNGYEAIPKVSLSILTTESGLEISVPNVGDQVWDSTLPATPYFNPSLYLRSDGIAKGFTIKPK